jgi:hypothetical protein
LWSGHVRACLYGENQWQGARSFSLMYTAAHFGYTIRKIDWRRLRRQCRIHLKLIRRCPSTGI